jgi:hypothetical protein
MGWGGKKGFEGKDGGKGFGKAKGGKSDLILPGDNEEFIWEATTQAVEPILPQETELDQNKLEKRIRDCFRKGAKDLSFARKPWFELVEEYAEASFSGIFNSLGDREWLVQYQCDLLLCLDAGVKDNFPKQALAGVMKVDLEQVVLAAYDRCFQEQRNLPVMWDTVAGFIDGPKGKKKVYNAIEAGWKQAYAQFSQYDVQSFVGSWIDMSIAALAEVTNGEPQYTLEIEVAPKFFDALLQAGTLPYNLVEQYGPPPENWGFVHETVQQVYAMHCVPEEQWPTKKKKKTQHQEDPGAAYGAGGGFAGGCGKGFPKGGGKGFGKQRGTMLL